MLEEPALKRRELRVFRPERHVLGPQVGVPAEVEGVLMFQTLAEQEERAMKALFTAVVLAGGIGTLSGCAPQQTKEDQANQKEATAAAIKALERVKAATQVGVDFKQYGGMVIDAKFAVNEAERILPDG